VEAVTSHAVVNPLQAPPVTPSAPRGTFIDLYAGCGGLSLGLMLAGWSGLFAVEKDALAFQTLSHNLIGESKEISYEWPSWFPKNPCSTGTFINKYREHIAALRGQVNVITGGLPCQGFSLAGRRKSNDPRNSRFKHYTEIVDLIQPEFLLLENVKGIAVEFGKKKREQENKRRVGRPPKSYLQRIKEKLEALGYEVFADLVKAVDFGVPQFRPRYIMFAIKRSFLSERIVDPFAILQAKRLDFLASKGLPFDQPISVREAISDLETSGKSLIECVDSRGFQQIAYTQPQTHYQRLLHGSMNGIAPNSLRLARHRDDIKERFTKILSTCRRGVQLSKKDRELFGIKKNCIVPLDGDKPSHTLTTLPDDILHYSEPRILTVREYARLQSFPDWYLFKGKYTTGGDRRVRECPRYTQVGNAVPPFLAELLGMVLHDLKQNLQPDFGDRQAPA
jgi:DNA (cytosine-5)-methyltransferase 1